MSDHSSDNEKLLLIKISQGDEIAFGQLFKTYYNQLGDFILRITESALLTQEIVQDVFLKVWINRNSLATVNCFKAYLLVIARNHTINCLKQIARERCQQKEWVNSVLHQAVNNAEEAYTSDTGKLIDEAVELLPARQKKVYTLSWQMGIRQQEIARELNISQQTVKKHMALAIRFLKRHLRTYTGFILLMITSFLPE